MSCKPLEGGEIKEFQQLLVESSNKWSNFDNFLAIIQSLPHQRIIKLLGIKTFSIIACKFREYLKGEFVECYWLFS